MGGKIEARFVRLLQRVLLPFLIAAFTLASIADVLERWTWLNPLPQGYDLKAVAFGDGKFVAVGDVGTILVSETGAKWRIARQGFLGDIGSVAYGNGVFVAVPPIKTLLRSTNGVDWESVSSSTTNYLAKVVFVNGQFVAFGGSYITTSTDGKVWTPRAEPAGGIAALAYGNGIYVASGSLAVFTSTDLTEWRREPVGFFGEGAATFSEGRFLLAAHYFIEEGNSSIYVSGLFSSPDGRDWVHATEKTTGLFLDFLRANDRFMAIETRGLSNYIVESDDGGTNWTAGIAAFPYIADLAYGNEVFVGVGAAGQIIRSLDGRSWEQINHGSTERIYDAKFIEGQFLLASGSPNSIRKSVDGLGWMSVDLGTTIGSVAFEGGTYVAVGSEIHTSTDTVNWVRRESPTTNFLNWVVSANGAFVTTGFYAPVFRSTNGLDWQMIMPMGLKFFLASGNGWFGLGGGELGYTTFLISSNGLSWSAPLSGTPNQQRGAAWGFVYGNGVYALQAGGFLFSRSTQAWRPFATPNLWTLSSAGGQFIGTEFSGEGGHGYTSNRGTYLTTSVFGTNAWMRRAPLHVGIRGLVYGNGRYLAYGDNGFLLVSDDALRPLRIEKAKPGPRLVFDGMLGRTYTVHASTNLSDWSGLFTTNLSNPVIVPIAGRSSAEFFRADEIR